MATVFDVANFFVELAQNDENDTITNMRVNKLLYFAQAWYMVRYDKPMFEEDFEAWEFGPVIPVIYKKYSKYKKNHIADVSDDYSADVFTNQELETLIDVANYYGRYSTAALVDKTHLRNGPWDVTLQNRKSIINKESIKEFYKNEVPLDSFDIPKWMYDSAEEGYRNSEGVKVFKRD